MPQANDDALSWHQMQGFRQVHEGASLAPLEEKERICAERDGFALLRLTFEERPRRDSGPIRNILIY